MMTKEQHIAYWISSAKEDWLSVEALLDRKRYLHCLFWAHLTLEKLAKALWVKHHEANLPPKTHNITWLLDNSNVDLGKDSMEFLANFNDFQLSGRYPDYLNQIHKVCTESFTINELTKVKEVRTCLLKMLPLE
ncbi:MAG: HEPN domain-containing protein [Prevotellaceae bacterium]|jgi:HEPN domain-containing protein|nr:HEPN domain-containing protein [Prevotellaceae bacterium]